MKSNNNQTFNKGEPLPDTVRLTDNRTGKSVILKRAIQKPVNPYRVASDDDDDDDDDDTPIVKKPPQTGLVKQNQSNQKIKGLLT